MDFFLLIGHVCIMDKDHQMKFNKYINHLIHQVMFDLWQHLHLLQGQI
jgi:hypothetical protein